MSTELKLFFTGSDQVQVQFNRSDSGTLPFVNPLTEKDRKDIQWYLEVYGTRSLADPDDDEAKRIKSRLPEIGKALFNAVFENRAAQRVFNEFQDCQRVAEQPCSSGKPLAVEMTISRLSGGEAPWPTRPRSILQSRQALLGVTSSPGADGVF